MATTALAALAQKALKAAHPKGRDDALTALQPVIQAHGQSGDPRELAALEEICVYLAGSPPARGVSGLLDDWRVRAPGWRASLPAGLLGAVLAACAAGIDEKIDWDAWLLANASSADLDDALASGLLKPADLGSFAKKHPEEAYRHPAFDCLLDLKKSIPLPVLDSGLTGAPRPEGLLSFPGAIATWLSYEANDSAASWIVTRAASNPGVIEQVLVSLLRNPLRTMTLAVDIGTYPVTSSGSFSKRKAEEFESASHVFVAAVSSAEGFADSRRSPARVFLGASASALGQFPKSFTERTHEIIRKQCLASFTDSLARELHALEGNRALRHPESVFALTPSVAYTAVTKYLDLLGAGNERGGGDAASDAARLKGMREVLEPLLSVADLPTSSSQARDIVDDILFNAGVRPIGTVGETQAFSPRHHQLAIGAALEGDLVSLVQVGWMMKTGSEPLVLRKAVVTPIAEN